MTTPTPPSAQERARDLHRECGQRHGYPGGSPRHACIDCIAQALATVAAEARAEADRYRHALVGLGYHAPGLCQHGLSHWLGDRCAYDLEALRPRAPDPGPAEGR
jgi:hypothetical protein